MPSGLLRVFVGAFDGNPDEVRLQPVNVQGSRYQAGPDGWRVGLALLREQPILPTVIWPADAVAAAEIVEAAGQSGFTVEREARSLTYVEIDLLA